MTPMDQFRATYFQECDERLAALESQLFMLADPAEQAEAINGAFRSVHSIKGGAAMFGFTRLIAFAHAFESVLDHLRKGDLAIESGLVERLVQASDILADLAEEARSPGGLSASHELSMVNDLAALGGQEPSDVSEVPESERQNSERQGSERQGSERQFGPETGQPAAFRISFRPSSDALRRGHDPLAIVRNLRGLGTLDVILDWSSLPPLEQLDPAACHLAWAFELTTASPIEDIRSCFGFASEGAALDIVPMPSEAQAPAGAAGAGSQSHHAQSSSARPERRSTSIRIDLDRVEKLVNLVGEVSIAQAMVLQYIDKAAVDANPLLFRALGQLQKLTRGLQDGVMAIRAQPVRSVFSRMPRVARDVAQETGRLVTIQMAGEETEIDKTIVDQLADPLIHIVRNAIDHGIEPPAERRALGKPETGLLRLSAAQRGGRIVIEISDDGRGIDRDGIKQRAIERHLIGPDADLTAEQIDNLIFLPGLSTAYTITGISGRGVGMDVVRKNIQSIGGRVSVQSRRGQGTITTIILPLTLAVMDGMLVSSGAESYLIPVSNVMECVVVARSQLALLPGSGEVIRIRGQHIPAVDLARTVGQPHGRRPDAIQVVVVETESSGRVGVIVDEIHGSQQIVVKSIRGPCGDVSGIAGATILGDGSIGLILDVSQLAQHVRAVAPAGLEHTRSTDITGTEGFAA